MVDSKKVCIGSFGKPFGLSGHLHLNSFTVPKKNILKLTPWQIEEKGKWKKIALETSLLQGKNIIVKLANCDDRKTASTYTNQKIAIERRQLPTTKENEYYWTDLEGLTVINRENVTLGIVEYLYATPRNDLLVVKTKNSPKSQQHLIPFIKDVVLKVDLKSKTITVDWEF